jgi:hypothetical protein
MAIGNVMDYLPDGPPSGPIGRIELLLVEVPDSLAKVRARCCDFSDPLGAQCGIHLRGPIEFSHGISQIHKSILPIEEHRDSPGAGAFG